MRETPGQVGAGDLGDILFRVYSQRFQLRAACIASRRTKRSANESKGMSSRWRRGGGSWGIAIERVRLRRRGIGSRCIRLKAKFQLLFSPAWRLHKAKIKFQLLFRPAWLS